MKNKLQLIIKVFIAGICAIAILSLFCLIYSYSGIHIVDNYGATDYKWEPNQLKVVTTEGMARFNIDENGYNNRVIYNPGDIDVLLMGSSHMEAVNVQQDENVGYLLDNKLENMNLYNIGISGHQIYNCINNIDDAICHFQPSKYVIIETDSVKMDIEKMMKVIDGSYEHIPSYDSGLLYYLQKYAPAVKIIFKDLQIWASMDKSKNINKSEEIAAYSNTEYMALLDNFISKAGNIAAKYDVELIIFYHPTTKINEEGMFELGSEVNYLDAFSRICSDNDICFVDMSKEFVELYNKEHILAHGFNNTGLGEGHLNKYGHRVIAERLIDVIGKGAE